MATFIDTTVDRIDARLRELQDERSNLEAARAALLKASSSPRRANSPRRAASSPRPSRTDRRRGGQGRVTRASQALDLIRRTPGITIPELARTMKIEPNYLYRVLPKLTAEGSVRRDGNGWHPTS